MEQEKKCCHKEPDTGACACGAIDGQTDMDGTDGHKDTNGTSGTDCAQRTKERSDKEYRDLQNRLNRIEGQVRGVKKMLENNAYCPDILIQVSAVNAALNSFNRVLLANHIRSCVVDDIRENKDEAIDELVATLQKLMK